MSKIVCKYIRLGGFGGVEVCSAGLGELKSPPPNKLDPVVEVDAPVVCAGGLGEPNAAPLKREPEAGADDGAAEPPVGAEPKSPPPKGVDEAGAGADVLPNRFGLGVLLG